MATQAKSGIDLVLERYGLSTREEERERWRREEAALRRLPDLLKRVLRLERARGER